MTMPLHEHVDVGSVPDSHRWLPRWRFDDDAIAVGVMGWAVSRRRRVRNPQQTVAGPILPLVWLPEESRRVTVVEVQRLSKGADRWRRPRGSVISLAVRDEIAGTTAGAQRHADDVRAGFGVFWGWAHSQHAVDLVGTAVRAFALVLDGCRVDGAPCTPEESYRPRAEVSAYFGAARRAALAFGRERAA